MVGDPDEALERERQWRRMHGDGRHSELAGALVAAFGSELVGFVAVVLGDAQEAREVFSEVSESLLTRLEAFEGRSSFRTWCYAIARNAALNAKRRRRPERLRTDEALGIPFQDRTATRPFRRTTNKLLLARLREELSEDEQMLLTLRLDRNMRWRSIAAVLGDVPEEVVAASEVSRLRKRFERLKGRLKEAFLMQRGPERS